MKRPLSPAIHSPDRSGDLARAEQIAADALSFLAADPDRLARFFEETGLSPADLRRVAGEPGFPITLLDYLAADQRRFVEFAKEHDYRPEVLDRIRQSLAPRIDDP